MSEPIPAEIRIGGRVPANLVEGLLAAIRDDRGAIDWEGSPVPTNVDQLLSSLGHDNQGDRHLRLYNTDANYGEFSALEGFLREHQLPYDRHSAAKYEYDGALIVYRPGMSSPRVFHASQDGQMLVRASDLIPLVSLLEADREASSMALTVQNASETASRLRFLLGLNVPELPPFEIVRTPV